MDEQDCRLRDFGQIDPLAPGGRPQTERQESLDV
jgi:hypothetical protein